jgi:hypothetical protein
VEPTEEQFATAKKLARESPHTFMAQSAKDIAQALADEHAKGRSDGLEEAARLLEHPSHRSPGMSRDRAAALIREIK